MIENGVCVSVCAGSLLSNGTLPALRGCRTYEWVRTLFALFSYLVFFLKYMI